MKILIAFGRLPDSPGDAPTVCVATDEYIIDAWGGRIPDYYREAIARDVEGGAEIREVWIDVPNDEIDDRFAIPTVAATVDKE